MFSVLASMGRGLRSPLRTKLNNNRVALLQPPPPQQHRWNWQIFLDRRFDKETGKYKYDDWDRVIMSVKEPRLANGMSLLRRSLMRNHHVKPTTKKKRVNEGKEYRRKIKRIDDLTNYIQFMKEVRKKKK